MIDYCNTIDKQKSCTIHKICLNMICFTLKSQPKNDQSADCCEIMLVCAFSFILQGTSVLLWMIFNHPAHVCLSQSPMFDGKVPHWHHFSCFWLRAAVQSPSDISGFTDLRWDDQEKVKKAIESGGATGGDFF